VDQQKQKQIDDMKSARPPALWVRPALIRLEAGAAEFGDVSSADSQPGFS